MTPPSDGYVVITPGEVYREVLAVKSAVNTLNTLVSPIPETLRDQETRIRSLEMRVWMAAGVVALVVASASVAVPLIT